MDFGEPARPTTQPSTSLGNTVGEQPTDPVYRTVHDIWFEVQWASPVCEFTGGLRLIRERCSQLGLTTPSDDTIRIKWSTIDTTQATHKISQSRV